MSETAADWPLTIYRALRGADIRQMAYVPDAGHARLIELMRADQAVQSSVLTTEEEGVPLAAGAWLGGQRTALLMQSSGVGNCVNMLSLMETCRFPLLTLVTMRGEWAEFNPWQAPMGRATQPVLEAMGVTVFRLERAEETEEVIGSALSLAFGAEQRVAVLIAQRMIGRKEW